MEHGIVLETTAEEDPNYLYLALTRETKCEVIMWGGEDGHEMTLPSDRHYHFPFLFRPRYRLRRVFLIAVLPNPATPEPRVEANDVPDLDDLDDFDDVPDLEDA